MISVSIETIGNAMSPYLEEIVEKLCKLDCKWKCIYFIKEN